MKIKSITDVITNSSSEVFVIRKTESAEEIIKKLKEYHESHKMTWEIYKEKYEPQPKPEMYEKIRQDGLDYFPSGDGGTIDFGDETLGVEIDENFSATHDFVEKNYEVLGKYHI